MRAYSYSRTTRSGAEVREIDQLIAASPVPDGQVADLFSLLERPDADDAGRYEARLACLDALDRERVYDVSAGTHSLRGPVQLDVPEELELSPLLASYAVEAPGNGEA